MKVSGDLEKIKRSPDTVRGKRENKRREVCGFFIFFQKNKKTTHLDSQPVIYKFQQFPIEWIGKEKFGMFDFPQKVVGN